jgi:hypothetical protein
MLITLTFTVRDLFDTLAPVTYTPGMIHPRSAIMSWTLVLIFAFTGARAVWLTKRIRSGVFVASITAALGAIGSILSAGAMLAIWHDPATLQAWQSSGGLDEALWGVPLLLIPIGLVTGTIGAAASRILFLPLGSG